MSARTRAIVVAIGGAAALAAAMGIGRFVYTPILPQMADALSLSKSTAGLIAAANFLGYLGGAMFAAVSNLPGSRRIWMLGALAVVAATTAGMSLGETTASFLLLRFVCGAASAIVLVMGSALVTEELATLGHRGLTALHFSGVGFGIAGSTAMLAAMEAGGAGWRPLWMASGFLASMGLVLFAALSPRDPPTRSEAAVGAVAETGAARTPGLIWLYLSYGLFGLGYVVTATFLVAAMAATASNPMPGLLVWMTVGLTGIPSLVVWSHFGRMFGALQAYCIACLIEMVGVAIGGFAPGPVGAMIAAVLLGATFMGITALGLDGARGIAPHRLRQVFAIMTACFGVGQILGPLLAGTLMDRTHSFLAASLMGSAALLGSGLGALMAGRASGAGVSPRPRSTS